MSHADDLLRFIDASPSPFHAVATAAAVLEAAGWNRVSEREAWPASGRHYLVRGGSLVAWHASGSADDTFRVIGAHTDSPNLRLKQQHDKASGVIALEPYGGPLLESWLDRDLGVSGRVVDRDGTERLVRVDEPLVRVPRLAIHLTRGKDEDGIDPQRDLVGLWSVGAGEFLAAIDAADAVGFDLMVHDLTPSARVGRAGELVAAPRLDNLASCHAAVQAIVGAGSGTVIALFDHEEVGSASERGAQSDLLATTLERIVLAAGGNREDFHRAIAGSVCASADMAHATHPARSDKHEPLHRIQLGGGPVVKVNQNLRYASEPHGVAAFVRACDAAGVPFQRYVHRADLPCGSTIGPATAARTGMITVDVGAPQLAMHSARETMAAADVDSYVAALSAFLAGGRPNL